MTLMLPCRTSLGFPSSCQLELLDVTRKNTSLYYHHPGMVPEELPQSLTANSQAGTILVILLYSDCVIKPISNARGSIKESAAGEETRERKNK